MYNAWIDAPVMSREHAELKLDSQSQVRVPLSPLFSHAIFLIFISQTVFIRDVGSLHGTYHNDTKLREGQSQALSDGDLLKFGISIDRGRENFPQCTMKVALDFGPPADQTEFEAMSAHFAKQGVYLLMDHSVPLAQPTVFQVPDESDSDDMDDMDETENMDDLAEMSSPAAFSSIADDDEEIQTTAAVLTESGLDLEFHGFDTSDPIDLTSEPDLVAEDNIPSSSSAISFDSDLPAHNAELTADTIDIDDMDPGTLRGVSVALPNDGFAPVAQSTHITVDIADDEIPGMGGPLSEDQNLPPLTEIPPSIMRARELGEISGKPEYFIAREQNRLLVKNRPASQLPEAPPVVEFYKTDIHASTVPFFEFHNEEVHVPTVPVDISTPDSSKKRKADQMSESTSLQPPSATLANDSVEQPPQKVISPNAEQSPTYKRVKTAAEYVGLMAIGGAAVMTALIASAPSF